MNLFYKASKSEIQKKNFFGGGEGGLGGGAEVISRLGGRGWSN